MHAVAGGGCVEDEAGKGAGAVGEFDPLVEVGNGRRRGGCIGGSAGEDKGERVPAEQGAKALGQGEGGVLLKRVGAEAGTGIVSSVGGVEKQEVDVVGRLLGAGDAGPVDGRGSVLGQSRSRDEQEGETSDWELSWGHDPG